MATNKDKLDLARQIIIDDLEGMAREFSEVARSEGTTQAYEKYFNVALKAVPGLAADEKKDQYANLPVIHIQIGTAGTQSIDITPAPLVIEAEPAYISPFKTSAATPVELPEDPLELLAAPPAETTDAELQAVRDTLASAATAMAMFDDDD